ncbi:Beta-xylosidase [Aquisphaera giovannonii]|uniref:Beta-xylosidase n=1 Tax=Aquisphaera giovannonii TaxID=406548 RepID=A0A5B9VZB4_9BACT|nr:cellulase family glycosylhydrolase [Aquisphaera giovannonii]QEH33307.1 Beta-xylosidase [Aquisphaera giovannonii]
MAIPNAHRAWLPALAVLGCSAAASAADLPPPVVSAGLGVNIHFTRPSRGEMERFAEAGFGLVRMDMSWAAIEHERGRYDFAAHDELLGHLAKVGARPIFILDYGNPLYNQGLAPASDADRAAFARFAAAAARHYRGKRVLLEIWNEPNLDGFWKPKADRADYAKLAVAAARAIREADPHATVLAPGSSGFPWEFLEASFAAGLLDHIDAVSVHPYREDAPESAATDYGRLRALIARHASPSRRELPIISSEWGYSTAEKAVDEETQASYLARQWLSNLASGVNTSIFYDWKDDGDDPKDRECRFGTVRTDLAPKPSFLAAQALIRNLRGYAFRHRLRGSTVADWKLLFEGPAASGSLVVASWSATGGRGATGSAPSYRQVSEDDPSWRPLRRLAAVRWQAGPLSERRGELTRLGVRIVNPEPTRATVGIRAIPPGPGTSEWTEIVLEPNQEHEGSVVLPGGAGIGSMRRVQLEVTWNGEPLPATAPLDLWRTDPLELAAAPWRDELELIVSDPSRVGFSGSVTREVHEVATWSGPVRIAAGQAEGRVRIPLGREPIRVLLKDDRSTILGDLEPRRYVPFPGFDDAGKPRAAFTAILHVENVGRTPRRLHAERSAADAPSSYLIQVPYQFDKGWRYLTIAPEQTMEVPAGADSAVVWVRGNTSGDALNCRYRDSTGQVFQVSLGHLTRPGWYPVTIRFDGAEKTFHYGGANDGIPHGPLRWEALLLIDSTHRDRHSAPMAAAFASPFYVFNR